MPSGNITATDTLNYTPELWELGATDAVQFKQVIVKRANSEFEGDVSELGKAVNIPSMSNFTVADKATNTDATPEHFVHPTQKLNIDKHKVVAVKLEKFALKQAMPEYRTKVTQRLGYPIARVMETDLAGLFSGWTGNAAVGALGNELSDSDWLTAWTNLVAAGAIEEAMTDEDTSIFLSPQAYAAALKIDKFSNKDYGASSDAVSKAALGAIYGSTTYLSNLLVAAGGGHHCAWIHRNAITMAVQEKTTVEVQYRALSVATEVVADSIYGFRTLTRPGEGPANITLTDNFGQWLPTV